MKMIRTAFLITAALLLSFTIHAQYDGVLVSQVKLMPGQWENFFELEKEIEAFHQARVDRGIITSRFVYRNIYAGDDDPYHFIVVTHFDDFKKSEDAFPKEMIDEFFSKEEQAAYWEKAPKIMKVTKREFFDKVAGSETFKPFKYLQITQFYVKPADRWTFEKQRKEILQPHFNEVVSQGHHAGWSFWKKDPSDKKYQYVSVNTYEEYGDWKNSVPHEDIFKKVFPDKDFNKTRTEVMGNRVAIKSEYWKLEHVTKPAQE